MKSRNGKQMGRRIGICLSILLALALLWMAGAILSGGEGGKAFVFLFTAGSVYGGLFLASWIFGKHSRTIAWHFGNATIWWLVWVGCGIVIAIALPNIIVGFDIKIAIENAVWIAMALVLIATFLVLLLASRRAFQMSDYGNSDFFQTNQSEQGDVPNESAAEETEKPAGKDHERASPEQSVMCGYCRHYVNVGKIFEDFKCALINRRTAHDHSCELFEPKIGRRRSQV